MKSPAERVARLRVVVDAVRAFKTFCEEQDRQDGWRDLDAVFAEVCGERGAMDPDPIATAVREVVSACESGDVGWLKDELDTLDEAAFAEVERRLWFSRGRFRWNPDGEEEVAGG